MAYVDRYKEFRLDNEKMSMIPFINIPVSVDDKYITYQLGVTRFDKLSQKYYTSPYFDWLILQANPQFSFEFLIPNGAILRIPQLDSALTYYFAQAKLYNIL